MKRRTYGQFCGLARALDVLGERWTLLVVRELLTGPKRYKDLLLGLDGIGTNMLARRLKTLEAHGLIVRRRLSPPASTEAYALTQRGSELEPVLLELADWGLAHVTDPPAADEAFHPAWSLLTLQARFRPEAAAGLVATCEYRVEEEIFHARLDAGTFTTQQGPASRPDFVLTTDAATFRALATGAMTTDEARSQGLLTLEGDAERWARCRRFFDLAADATPPDDEMAVLDLTMRPSPRARRIR